MNLLTYTNIHFHYKIINAVLIKNKTYIIIIIRFSKVLSNQIANWSLEQFVIQFSLINISPKAILD